MFDVHKITLMHVVNITVACKGHQKFRKIFVIMTLSNCQLSTIIVTGNRHL